MVVIMVAVRLLGAGPVQTLLRACILLAVDQRQRRGSLVRTADDGQKLQQTLDGLGLRQDKVGIVGSGQGRGQLAHEHLHRVGAVETAIGDGGQQRIAGRRDRAGAHAGDLAHVG